MAKKEIDFMKLFSSKQMGFNGHSAEYLKETTSPDLIELYTREGSTKYFKEIRKRLANKGFYKELMKFSK